MRCFFIGQVSGYHSYNVVSKGLIRGLLAGGVDVVCYDASWNGSEDHTDPFLLSFSKDRLTWVGKNTYDKAVSGQQVDQDLGSVVLALNPTVETLKLRKYGFVMAGFHVGDVDKVPYNWKKVMNEEDAVIVPSRWMQSVVENSGVTTPIVVANHGVNPVFEPDTTVEFNDSPSAPFIMLHPCSSVFYPERKGTPQLLEAFTRLVDEKENVLLRLMIGVKTKPIKKLLKTLPDHVMGRIQVLMQGGGHDAQAMASAYHRVHLLVAPSRAEGFGITPIESRACGTPVVQTFCTGHADHAPDEMDMMLLARALGIIVVPHGPLAPAWGGGFGKAPTVEAEWIYRAIQTAMRQHSTLKRAAMLNASKVRKEWSWEARTEPLVAWIKATEAFAA